MAVKTAVRGQILLITLQREEKRNAIDPDTTAAIDAALNRLEDDPQLRVAIITGGPSMFSAGTDLKVTAGPPTERGGEYGIIRRRHCKPIIAAVEGLALGGGMEIALACDLVVASRTARFGLPEVQRSLVPIYGGLFRSLRALPRNVAKELLLTGDPLGAERAYALGLVNVLTEPGGALEAAFALADRILKNGPVALRETIAVVEDLTAAEDARGWELSERAAAVLWQSEDTIEGRNAFLEKRQPVWRGR
jgi:enoyl-CoA hydratase